MARIVGGSPIGELRGKMGGFVFARNASGAYVRSYVVPVNPNTIAQTRARAQFASAAGSWHSLEDSTKSLWNSFAKTHYNPQRGANNGQFSGMNAYTALVNGYLQMQALGTAGTVSAASVIISLTKTNPSLTQPIIPPNETLVNQIATNGTIAPGEVAQMSLGSLCQLTENYSWQLQINLSEPIDINDSVDSKGNKFGFAVFASEALDQPNMFVQNPYLQMLAPIKPFELNATLPAADEFYLRQTAGRPAEDFRTRASVGQYVRMTAVMLGADGQFAKIGSKVVQVASAFI